METQLKILSYNVFLRPQGIISHFNINGDFKKSRLLTLANVIENYDIVLLQEIFDINLFISKKTKLIKLAEKLGFKYNIYSNSLSIKPVDSGLLILSKLPIVDSDSVIYDSCFSYDMLSNKGILYAKVLLPNNHHLHIFNTHTQSGDDKNKHETKMKQLDFLVNYINSKVPTDESILIGGDLNLDSIHNIEYQDNSYKLKKTIESNSYKDFIKLLNNQDSRNFIDCLSKIQKNKMKNISLNKYVFNIDTGFNHFQQNQKLPDNNTYVDSPFFIRHKKQYSKQKKYTLYHPITTFGHGDIGIHKKDKSNLLRSIDYIFLLSPKNQSFSIKLIDAITRPFINTYEENKFTTLSDHYGIEILLSIKKKYLINYIEK